MVLATLQKHSKYLVIQKDAVLLSPIEKIYSFFLLQMAPFGEMLLSISHNVSYKGVFDPLPL